MAVIKYKDKNGNWKTLTESVNIKTETESGVFIGTEDELVDPSIRVWYDTAYDPPVAKCKLDDGSWVTIAGVGTGGGTGSSDNDAKMNISNKTGWNSKTIAYGAVCEVKVWWESYTEDEEGNKEDTGEGTAQIIVNDKIKATFTVAQGDLPPINLSQYLDEGNNKVQFTIYDVYDNPKTLVFRVNTVKISIEDIFGNSALSKTAHSSYLDFKYKAIGSVVKTVYFVLDGELCGTQTVSDTDNDTQTFRIDAQSHGHHTFEVYFEGKIDDLTTVESDHLFYDIIWQETGNNTPIVACSFNTKTVKQYATVVIPYLVYDPQNDSSVNVTIKDNFGWVAYRTVDRGQKTIPYKATNTSESTKIYFYVGDSKEPARTIEFDVMETIIPVSAETKDLQLHLTAQERSNNDTNTPNEQWTFGDVTTSFYDFTWGKVNGWLEDEETGESFLRVSGNAYALVDFKIFEEDLRINGKTIEFEFATRDVIDYDATIISAETGGKGITITAQKALLKSAQSEIFTSYKEDEHIRVTFCVGKVDDYCLLSIYLNGVLSGVKQYPSDDDFSQGKNPVKISIGSNKCTVDIYNIRVYGSELTRHQILNNWIADTQNIEQRIERYERNNIFESPTSRKITPNTIPPHLPYLVIQRANLPAENDDKEYDNTSGYYVDPLQPEKCFEFTGAILARQGTSSMAYRVPNIKMKYNGILKVNGVELDENDGYKLRDYSIPTRTFTYKSDVASIEGANNLKLVQLFDDINPARTPPQRVKRADGNKVRQGIDGVPMVVFHDNGEDIVYIGKYNFNNDKGTHEVYGFKDGDECWSVEVNVDDLVLYKNADFSGDWESKIEARYPKKNKNINNLKALIEWIASTDPEQADPNSDIEPIIYEDIPTLTITEKSGDKKITKIRWSKNDEQIPYTKDTMEYRLAKFRNEAPTILNIDSTVFFYLFTSFFLMIDNWAKNSFPTYFADDGLWYWLPYDFDTAIGINNEGHLVFDYNLENTDMIDGGFVFNAQNSVLWNNVRYCFDDRVRETYGNLRSKENGTPLLDFQDVVLRFRNHQKVWGEAIFNEDMYLKHLLDLFEKGNAEYLKMALGDKELQRVQWLYNRFRFYDSKYLAGDTPSDVITFRSYGMGDITMIPYADIYTCVQWASKKLNSEETEEVEEEFKRTPRGTESTFTCPFNVEVLNDTEINIFSASQLSDLGDLSPLVIGGFNKFSTASRIKSLKIGALTNADGTPYSNGHLKSLSLGNNTLLRELNVRNCYNLNESLGLSNCPNIEYVYAEGSGITGVSLPSNGGILKELCLPSSVTNLTIIGQSMLEKLSIPSYSNISILWLEEVDFTKRDKEGNFIIDVDTMIDQVKRDCRVRITGLDKTFENAGEIEAFLNKFSTFTGRDNQGINTNDAFISGVLRCKEITYEDFIKLDGRFNGKYDYIRIVYETMTGVITYYLDEESKNNGEYLCQKTILIGRDGELINTLCPDPISDETISTPVKSNRVEDGAEKSKYEFNNWDRYNTVITGDTDVIAVFDEYMMHKVKFVTDKDVILSEDTYYCKEGENVIVSPVDQEDYDDIENNHRMYFQGWRDFTTKVKINFPLKVTENIYEELKFEAFYDPKQLYIVQFIDPYNKSYADAGYVISLQRLETGETIIIPDNPATWNCEDGNMGDDCAVGKHCHTFVGWGTEPKHNGLEEDTVTPETIMGENAITYYAVYRSDIKSYTITFKGIKGGTDHRAEEILSQKTLKYGDVIEVPTNTEVTGYTFQNRWLNEDGEVVTVDSTVLGDRTYVADYEINTYTIRFFNKNAFDENVQIGETQYVDYGDLPVDPSKTTKPTKPADAQYTYDFDGWDKGSVVEATQDVDYIATYKLTLNKYIVTWRIFDEAIPIEYDYGTFAPTPPTSYAVGNSVSHKGATYPISGYYPDHTTYEVTGDTEFTALIQKTGSIQAVPTKAGAGCENISSISSFLADTDRINTDYSKKSEFILYGFNFEALKDLSNVKVKELNILFEEAFSYVHSVDLQSFRFVKDFELSGNVSTYTDLGDGAIKLPTSNEPNGIGISSTIDTSYLPNTIRSINSNISDFINGYRSNTFGLLISYNNKLALRRITLNVAYTYEVLAIDDGVYLVTWDIMGKTLTSSYRLGDTPVPPFSVGSDVMIDGLLYNIKSWGDIGVVTQNTTYTAQYDICKYTIVYETLNGSPVIVEDVPYGSTLTPPTPTREHYTFTGWDRDIAVVTGDATYTAQYVPYVYTITKKPTASELKSYGSNIEYAYDNDMNSYAQQYQENYYGFSRFIFRDFNFNIEKDAIIKSVKSCVTVSSETEDGTIECYFKVGSSSGAERVYGIDLFRNEEKLKQSIYTTIPLEEVKQKLLEKTGNDSIVDWLNSIDSRFFELELCVGADGSILDKKTTNIKLYNVEIAVEYTMVEE